MQPRTLVIGKEVFCAEQMANKISSDIAFLEQKLQHAQTQNSINDDVINTYQGMITSRQNILSWLVQEQHPPLSA